MPRVSGYVIIERRELVLIDICLMRKIVIRLQPSAWLTLCLEEYPHQPYQGLPAQLVVERDLSQSAHWPQSLPGQTEAVTARLVNGGQVR